MDSQIARPTIRNAFLSLSLSLARHCTPHTIQSYLQNTKYKTFTFEVLGHIMYVLRYLLLHRQYSFGCFSVCVFKFCILFNFCVSFFFFIFLSFIYVYTEFVVILYMNKKYVFISLLFSHTLCFA